MGGLGAWQARRGQGHLFHYVSAVRIYLIYGYAKNDQEDLTPDQIKLLAQLMKDITHG